MNKLFFYLIYCCLMFTAIVTVQAQGVERSTNQSTISSVAVNDRDPKVRIAALNRSTNQSTISSVAVNDRDSDVRETALQMLK